MSDDLKRISKEQEEYLQEWLRRLDEAAQLVPQIKQVLEVKKWEAEAFAEAPETIEDLDKTKLYNVSQASYNNLTEALPQLPSIDNQSATLNLTASLAGGTATFDFIASTRTISHEPTREWATKHTTLYLGLQTSQNRSSIVRSLLHDLQPALVTEFEDIELTSAFTLGQVETAVSIKMRNLLEHFKGQLFERAIRRPQEQKITWPLMVSRLSLASIGSAAYTELLNQEHNWRRLHDELTDTAKNKDWINTRITNIAPLKARLIDHLYTVLSLVKLK